MSGPLHRKLQKSSGTSQQRRSRAIHRHCRCTGPRPQAWLAHLGGCRRKWKRLPRPPQLAALVEMGCRGKGSAGNGKRSGGTATARFLMSTTTLEAEASACREQLSKVGEQASASICAQSVRSRARLRARTHTCTHPAGQQGDLALRITSKWSSAGAAQGAGGCGHKARLRSGAARPRS